MTQTKATPMIANFSMYARPETNAVIANFWGAIRARLAEVAIDSPQNLTPEEADMFSIWLNPDLVLSQTCGFPFANSLHGKVALVGTPDFAVQDCPPGHYRSAFVVRRNDPRRALADFCTATFVYNEDMSQSGFNAPMCYGARIGVDFANRKKSGGHMQSAVMVAGGQADIAALDAVTWRLICKHDAVADQLRVLDWTTPATPALPLICAKGADVDGIFWAVDQAIKDRASELKESLGLVGLVKIPESDYLAAPKYSGAPFERP